MGSACVSDNAAIKSSQPGRYGVAGPVRVSLQPAATGTVWNLQGAADNAALIVRATSLWGVETLPAPHRIVSSATHRLMWVGPRSWLVFSLSPHAPVDPAIQQGFSDSRNQLSAAGGALFDVSASRVGWTLRGPRALDLLASGCPLDLHHSVFTPDSCAQSLFGHVAALYHRHADGDFTLYVARSFADDVWSALCASAAQYGYEVLPATQ